MTVDRISKIKETLKALSEKKAKAEGANENYLNQLKKEFGITSIEEAESKIEELQNKRDRITDSIAEKKRVKNCIEGRLKSLCIRPSVEQPGMSSDRATNPRFPSEAPLGTDARL